MDEIKAVAVYQKAKNGKAAGWTIYNDATGKRVGLDIRYATREAAEAAIPATVAALVQRIANAEVREAERLAALDALDHDAETAGGRGYRTVHDSAFGPGRVYDDQPGATQYDDGTGRYNIQIWDNS